MSYRLEIVLKEEDNEEVQLNKMSPNALNSFMAVVSSLKAMAESIIQKESLTYSIRPGSSVVAVDAPQAEADILYQEIESSIRGENEDPEFNRNLRIIQEQLKKENYQYYFNYTRGHKAPIQIHDTLIGSRKIFTPRKKKPFKQKIRIKGGDLNEVGGINPNYHIIDGSGEKITIACTRTQATEQINPYLYQDIEAVVISKEWTNPEIRNYYQHRIILEPSIAPYIKNILGAYNREKDLIKQLKILYQSVDEIFGSTKYGFQVLKCLLTAFNFNDFHQSEIKTLLVISAPFKNHELIIEARKALLYTYETKRK